MHEFALTQEIVKIVEESARGAGDDVKVTRVYLKIGVFSAVVAKYVQHYYDIMTENTNLHGAVLETIEVPATAECNNCQAEYAISNNDFNCPECGSADTSLLTGRELFVDSIEINEDV